MKRRQMTKREPFKGFHSSPEIIRLAVMLYVRFPPSLRITDGSSAVPTSQFPNRRRSLAAWLDGLRYDASRLPMRMAVGNVYENSLKIY